MWTYQETAAASYTVVLTAHDLVDSQLLDAMSRAKGRSINLNLDRDTEKYAAGFSAVSSTFMGGRLACNSGLISETTSRSGTYKKEALLTHVAKMGNRKCTLWQDRIYAAMGLAGVRNLQVS